jgi:hypothetical protein
LNERAVAFSGSFLNGAATGIDQLADNDHDHLPSIKYNAFVESPIEQVLFQRA